MIQPIPTRYAGCHFRSRLEARWAVFFDHLAIRWEYEAQGYDLPSGPYLPDFRLHGVGGDGDGRPYVWFEVKPDIDEPDDPRWSELCLDAPVLVAFGMPPANRDILNDCTRQNGWIELHDSFIDLGGERVPGWDSNRAFCTCPVCGRLGIAFDGRGERVCQHGGDADAYTYNDPRIVAAYGAARSARFEHGESGAS
jgi:hypothetical protein